VEELVGGIIVSHEDVWVAIAIVVGNSHSHAAPEVCRNAGLDGDVGERAIAIVAVERVGKRQVVAGIADGSNSRRTGRAARRCYSPATRRPPTTSSCPRRNRPPRRPSWSHR
jgi:hypothetical protein